MGGIITEYIGQFEDDKKTGKGTFKELGDDVLNPYTYEGHLFQDEFKDGLLVGSYLGQPSTSYSIRYKGSFMNISGVKIHLLDKFPAWDGELIFTWLETGESSKHIIEMGQCESYDLMRDKVY